MAQKGMNYIIDEAKNELLSLVNQQIKRGVPVAAIELILINLSTSISEVAKGVIVKEQDAYAEELEKERLLEEERLRKENEPKTEGEENE